MKVQVGDEVRVISSRWYRCEAGPGAEGVVVDIKEDHFGWESPVQVKLTKYNPDFEERANDTPDEKDVFDYEDEGLAVIKAASAL